MDFSAISKPVAFGAAPRGGKAVGMGNVQAPILLKHANRRLAALKEAKEIAAVLPGPGESLHALMTGRYDLTDLLEVILDQVGTAKTMRIATLSFNAHNVALLETWLAAKRVGVLQILASEFFRQHNPGIFDAMTQMFVGTPHRLAASRNHCKVVCMEFDDGQKLTLEGSANLRTNSNQEQFVLVNDPVLHDWHAAWIGKACGTP